MCQYPSTLNQILNSLPPLLMANTVLKLCDRKLTRKFAEQCKKINVHLYIVRY